MSVRSRSSRPRALPGALALGVGLSLLGLPSAAQASGGVALTALADRTIGSTVAPNGDNNPYSLSVVPAGYTGGPLAPGDVLVGDVNDSHNVQGQGSTILAFHDGAQSVFSTAVTAPIATTFNATGTALWVSAFGPADDGSQGSISVLHGVSNTTVSPAVVAGTVFPGGAIADPAGPWGVEFNHTTSAPAFFWTNADGSVVRDSNLGMPFGTSNGTKNVITKISQLSAHPNPSLSKGTVVAPQGMAYDPTHGILYVADSQSDQIVALAGANTATGLISSTVLLSGGPLHTPQGLTVDPGTGNLLVTNGAVDNNLIELTPAGAVVATRNLDPTGAPGALFGLTATTSPTGGTEIYYVNDNTNTLHLLDTSSTAVTLTGPAEQSAPYASTVAITGTAPAGSTVAIFFHRAGQDGYTQRRTLQADANGAFSTSYRPNDDYRYYAQVGDQSSTGVLTLATATVDGPAERTAPPASTVLLSGVGAPGTQLTLHFHHQNTPAGDYSILRTVAVNSDGTWTRPVVLNCDYRYYVSRPNTSTRTAGYLIYGS